MWAQGFQTPQAISLQGRFGVNYSYLTCGYSPTIDSARFFLRLNTVRSVGSIVLLTMTSRRIPVSIELYE